MENFILLCLRLDVLTNAVFKDNQIFIAVDRCDDFEPQLGNSLTDEATITAYESEIVNFTQIAKG